MNKPFRTPFSLANLILTNLLGDWDYQPEAPWEVEASDLAKAISRARVAEQDEIVGLGGPVKVAVHVWTGSIREATVEERLEVLKLALERIDDERAELRAQIKALSPKPFNLKKWKGEKP